MFLQTICPHEQRLDWMREVKKDSDMLLSFHSDTKDGHALNSLLGIFKQLLPTHIFS